MVCCKGPKFYHQLRKVVYLSHGILKNTTSIAGGWREPINDYDYKKALKLLQVTYGIFPYFKVYISNRPDKPYDYIIAIEEGEIGLPDKYFYNALPNDKIVRDYKLLMRDFAIRMDVVGSEAELFAEETFHYEKRIINHIHHFIKSSNERPRNEIITLSELIKIAPSLPIMETISAMFPHTKITEETEVLVRDAEILQQLSIVISTTDRIPIRHFIVWSLVRHLLPHLSKDFRTLTEDFDHSIYGRTATYPRWMVCTKLVRDWLPFAVDALQEKQRFSITNSNMKEKKFPNKITGNDEVLRLMFHTLKNELQHTLQQASWIEASLKQYLREKLTEIRIQIGIPEQVLYKETYLVEYYDKLVLSNIYFVEHLESIWSFRKSLMENKLKTQNLFDSVISELYTREEVQPIVYSNILNMLIISRGLISNYYDYKYPISINFARIGADILEVLIESIPTLVEQYNAERIASDVNVTHFVLPTVDVDCIVADERDKSDLKELSEKALKSFSITLSSAKIAARALSTFIRKIDTEDAIAGSSITPDLNYDNLNLKKRRRVPGLRSLNENELFTLAYMQKHCSATIADKDYAHIKPYVEQRLAERYLFNATWKHIQFLKRSISCSATASSCSNIL